MNLWHGCRAAKNAANRIAKRRQLRFTGLVWFELMRKFCPPEAPAVETVLIGTRPVPLLMVRNPRARRYLLRMRPDGTPRVTIPRGGSAAAARDFVERNRPWLERQWHQLQTHPRPPAIWQAGSTVWFRGDLAPIQSGQPGWVQLGDQVIATGADVGNLRPAIEKHLRQLAARELPVRLRELAARHGLAVSRVTVRAQRTRWGSCSRRATISLNWRLIQVPPFVRDYILFHELAHLTQMNHSRRFWAEVERLCPDYRVAERWIKEHREFLRGA